MLGKRRVTKESPHKLAVNRVCYAFRVFALQNQWLQLPPLLISLLKTGQWKLPGDVQPLRQMTGVRHPEDYSFLDIPEIVTETGSLFRIFEEGQGELYGLASSRRSGRAITEEHLLDIDRAVMIALDSSDHAICLDFRASETSPSVVLADKEEDSIVWRTIAEDFETFVNRLGL